MFRKYEYKFIRVGKGLLWTSSKAEKEYKNVILRHAKEGWRLVQVFSPGTGIYGASKYYEIILERKKI